MKQALICLTVLASACAHAQTRTPETCNATLARWHAENLSLSAKELNVEKLNGRIAEMLSCEIEFPNAPAEKDWMKQRSLYSEAIAIRLQHFLERHKLANTFLSEDESGQR